MYEPIYNKTSVGRGFRGSVVLLAGFEHENCKYVIALYIIHDSEHLNYRFIST